LQSLFNLQWTMPIEDLLRNLPWTWEVKEDGRIRGQVHGQEIFIDRVLIHEQLGISKEGSIDATNVAFEEAKTTFKRIIGPHAFVKNEQWNVVCMKEDFHVRFATILQIIYQRKRLTYFNIQITITFDLANRGAIY
jgi:hypothetical protein